MAGIWSRIGNGVGKALAALGSLAAAACVAPQPADLAGAAKPALWKLADADTTIYLFGTIHLLPEELNWRTPALEEAIARSETLVLETEVSSDPTAAAQTMMKLGISPGLPPLAERVPPEKREALERMIKATGVPAQALDRMETWTAALTLMAVSFRQMGFSSEEGVERSLSAGYPKPVKGLETVEQQFGFFDQLSEEAQRALLAGTIDDPGKAKAEFEAMLNACKRGDTDAIARTFDSEKALSPELRERLMKRRNAAWADWLAKRLDQPGTIMVAVGAGHLAGKDSVQKMLMAKGLRTTRIQ
jgi:uncharacterized protein YbaP (TraB family)